MGDIAHSSTHTSCVLSHSGQTDAILASLMVYLQTSFDTLFAGQTNTATLVTKVFQAMTQ